MQDKRLAGFVIAGLLAVFSLAAAYARDFLVTSSANALSNNEQLLVVGRSSFTGCGYSVGFNVHASSSVFSIAVSKDLVIGSTITVMRQLGTACPGSSVYKFHKNSERPLPAPGSREKYTP
jgi:hypothetical protein